MSSGRSESAGRERPTLASFDGSPNKAAMVASSIALLQHSPYSQTLERGKYRAKTPPKSNVSSRPLTPATHEATTSTSPSNSLNNFRPKLHQSSPSKSISSFSPRPASSSAPHKTKARSSTITKKTEHESTGILQPIKPKGQLQLSEAELNEEITIVLTAHNPQAPENVVVFNLQEGAYKLSPTVDQTTTIFDMDGYSVHMDTEEGRRQVAANQEEKRKKEYADKNLASGAALYRLLWRSIHIFLILYIYGGDFEDESGPVLRNPFNFTDRAVQTVVRPPRERATMTEPPPRATFSANVTQWEIYDAYLEEEEAVKLRIGDKGTRVEGDKKDKKSITFLPVSLSQTLPEEPNAGSSLQYPQSFSEKVKVVERMVCQNASSGLYVDYKYWDDPADQYQDMGTLLPLWKFAPYLAKSKTVTAISWSVKHPDLFAVGYGSYDFVKMTSEVVPHAELPNPSDAEQTGQKLPFTAGLVCCYTLNNTAYPDYMFITESGVMSLDFHPQNPSLLAVGHYDGQVGVYDLSSKSNKLLFASSVRVHKHVAPVWMVKWQEDDLSKNLNLYTVAADGRLTSWTLMKNEMIDTDVLELKVTKKPNALPLLRQSLNASVSSSLNISSMGESDQMPDDDDYETSLYGLAGGTCIDFQRGDHIYIVGTEEGCLHKCSKAYNGRFLETYEGHQLAVYSVQWNPYHPKIFMSCGADWCVKIWDHTSTAPLLTFDLKVPVCDVKWAPYSSSIFALLTADGKVSVYDLARSKHEPLCNQLFTKSVPTHLAFSPTEPLLLVGDSAGQVHCFKLSPNLRNISLVTDASSAEPTSLDKISSVSMLLPSPTAATKAKSAAAASAPSPRSIVGRKETLDTTEMIVYKGINVEQEVEKLEKILMEKKENK